MNLKTKFARVGAVATTLALASLGVAGVADADDGGYTGPDKEIQASLTIHKHVGENTDQLDDYTNETPDNLGVGIPGVTFTIQQVGTMVEGNCVAPDLGTPAGWEAIKDATVDNVCDIDGVEPVEVVTGEDGSIKQELPQGLYKVTETASGDNLVTQKAVPFLVTLPMPLKGEWIYDVHVYPKNKLGDSDVTKTVADPDKVVPGATVPWTITANIPEVALPYTSIVVKDTPADELADTTKVVKVTVNNTALKKDEHYELSDNDLTVTLTDEGLKVVNNIVTGESAEAATLSVEVETTIPEDAQGGEFKNEAEVLLNNKPYTPDGDPETIWGKLDVTKVEKGSTNTLAGAKFAVFEGTCGAAGTDPVATGETGTDGKFTQTLYIGMRNAGSTDVVEKTYCLKETAAPAGYILDENGVDFTLKADDATNFTSKVKFENVKVTGPKLPLTGAGGTMLLTGIGVALFATGLGIVVGVRRRNA